MGNVALQYDFRCTLRQKNSCRVIQMNKISFISSALEIEVIVLPI
jgi:hypothetical protein